jgi:FkbM family methyltransferase
MSELDGEYVSIRLPRGFNGLRMTRTGPMLYNRNDQYVGGSFHKYGEFSVGEADMFGQLVRPGMFVVEVGANIGGHTVHQLVGASGMVLAYEPQRIPFQTLCGNLALNQCANVVARQAVVGDAPGVARVPALPPDKAFNFGGLSLRNITGGEPVQAVTIDSESLPACHVMKIDVEGMETDVLAGARLTIERFKPRLYLENDREEHSAALIEAVLEHGYRAWWHTPPLFNADNFAGEKENIFGGTVSVNLLCIHASQAASIDGLREVSGPNDSWRTVTVR